MSLSVGAGMAIAGGVAAATTAGTAIAQGKLNRKNRKWQEKMYKRRLADQRQDWNMTNEYNEEMYNKYNSPSAQVRQLHSAGQNPDLQDLSSSGLGDASTPSSSPDVGDGSFDMPNIDFAGTFAQMMSVYQQLSSQAIDNDLKRQELKKIGRDDVLEHLTNLYNPKADFDERFNPIIVDADGFGTGKNGEIESIKYAKKGNTNKYYRNLGYSKDASRILTALERSFNKDEVRSNYYAKKLSTAEGRKDYFKSVTDGYFSESDEDLAKAYTKFNTESMKLYELFNKAQESSYNSQSAKGDFESDFYNSRNGKTEGIATTNILNSENLTKSGTSDIMSQIDSEFQSMLKGWRGDSWYDKIGKACLQAVYLGLKSKFF